MPAHTASMPSTIAHAANNAHAKWWRDPGLRQLNLLLVGPMLGSMAFGYDQALISGLLANPRWISDMNLTSSSLQGLTIAALSFGAIGAIIPAAYASDRLGRRWSIIFGNIFLIAGIIGQTLTNTAVQFLGTRLLLGFVDVFVVVSSPALLAELCHPRQRGPVTALYMTFFYVGAITAAWVSYGTLDINSSWSWRVPVLFQLFWSVMQTIAVFFCPESPRWLATKGRAAEAKDILAKYHANGVVSDELVEFEMQQILGSLEVERSEGMNGWHGWIAMFSTRGNITRSLLTIFIGLASQWVGNGIVSYYFAPVLATVGVTSPSQQQGINGGLQIFNWLMSIVGALQAERTGRIRMLVYSSAGMLVAMVLVTACSATYAAHGSSGSGIAVIAFLFIFFGAYDIAWTPIPPLYVSEIAPTNLRAKYLSLYWLSCACALCFNQYVNPVALAAIHWKYYIVYIGVLAVVIVVLWFLAPETKGLALEEVAGIFDKKAAEELEHTVERVKAHHDEQVEVVAGGKKASV